MRNVSKTTNAKATEAGIVIVADFESGNYVATDMEDGRVLYAGSVTPMEVLEAAIEAKAELAEDGEPESSKSVISAAKKAEYKEFNNSNGDDIAELMRGATTGANGKCDPAELRLVAAANGIEDRLDGYEAKELNVGMCRMNIGNVLRGLVRNGNDVFIDGATVPGEELEL